MLVLWASASAFRADDNDVIAAVAFRLSSQYGNVGRRSASRQMFCFRDDDMKQEVEKGVRPAAKTQSRRTTRKQTHVGLNWFVHGSL